MKPGTSQQPFTISRIRLINFHNLVNETIHVADGGHLFLLGDNGSGKTTILDAVHYVLTAGESMEFNAAARVTGRQAESGRRLQEVITRYNIDTGQINKAGGVTYAALEISGRSGRPMTVGVGLSVAAIDENVQRWGIIRECPLEAISFLIKEENGTRPRTREEMKQNLGEESGFYSIGAYRTEIANRLFGGEEQFGEVCEFLKMGKAYREIAARAKDYHELFKSLLPEPKTELFDRIIKALKDLDTSRADLDGLARKVEHLHALEALLKTVDEARDDQLRYAWLVQYLELDDLNKQQLKREADSERIQEERVALDKHVDERRRERDELGRRLADLQAKDTNGLVRQEKECAVDCERATATVQKRKVAVGQEEKKVRESQKQRGREREQLADQLRKFHGELGRQAPTLPFSLTELLAALDAAHRTDDTAKSVALAESLPVTVAIAQAETVLAQIRINIAHTTAKLDDARRRADAARKVLEGLEKQQEAMPELPAYGEALASLRHAMLTVQPLYAGLEWKPGLTRAAMAAVEEMIGDAVLGILLVPERDWDTAREIVYTGFPTLRLAQISPAAAEPVLPDWIRESFDLARSAPTAITCLVREMAADAEPAVTKWKQWRTASFRAHECRLGETPPHLIGVESRRQEWKRLLQRSQQEARECRQEVQVVEKQLVELQLEESRLTIFMETLRLQHDDVRKTAVGIARRAAELQFATDLFSRLQTQLEEAVSDEKRLRLRLGELQALVARGNLDQLEQKIKKLANQIKLADIESDKLIAHRGHLEKQAEDALADIRQMQARAAVAVETRDGIQTRLIKRRPELAAETLSDYILRIRKGQQFKTIDAVRLAKDEAARAEVVAATQIDERMKDPMLGTSFGFYYEKLENRLLDRRGQALPDVSAALQRQLVEQRELINERTQELFRKIIMAELVTFLKQHVSRLHEMIKKVNHLLGEREFGGIRYRLQITPVPACVQIQEIIRRHHPLDSQATEEELRAFFADHKDEILNADVDQIPAVLDYRNWYRYEMKMIIPGGTDGVELDRRTKSVGSGGEQAVPNYLLILTIAHFLYHSTAIKLHTLLFDEAFYGIDAARRDQILGFAGDLGLQLLVASPDQDGVKREIRHSTSVLVVKDIDYNVHLYPFIYENKELPRQLDLLDPAKDVAVPAEFAAELTPDA